MLDPPVEEEAEEATAVVEVDMVEEEATGGEEEDRVEVTREVEVEDTLEVAVATAVATTEVEEATSKAEEATKLVERNVPKQSILCNPLSLSLFAAPSPSLYQVLPPLLQVPALYFHVSFHVFSDDHFPFSIESSHATSPSVVFSFFRKHRIA